MPSLLTQKDLFALFCPASGFSVNSRPACWITTGCLLPYEWTDNSVPRLMDFLGWCLNSFASKLFVPLHHRSVSMKARYRVSYLAVLLLLAIGVACNQAKVRPDAQVTSDIQNKFNQDSGLQGKQLNVQAVSGVVTLDGTVDNSAERDGAARLAASVAGVKTVVNNLQIGQQPTPDQSAAAPPEPPKPTPRAKKHRHVSEQPVEDNSFPPAGPPAPAVANNTPPPPPAPASSPPAPSSPPMTGQSRHPMRPAPATSPAPAA